MTGNKEKQVKNSVIYLFTVVVNSALPLIAIALFSRILSKDDFGVLALAQIYAIFAGGLAHCGMTPAYERNFFQYRNDSLKAAQLLYSTILFVSVNFAAVAVLTYFFREFFANIIVGSAEYGDLLFWAFCGQFCLSLPIYYLSFYKNSEMADRYAKFTILNGALNLIVAIFFVVHMRIGVIGIVYAQALSGLFTCCFLTYKFARLQKPVFCKSIFFEAFKIGYPLTPKIFIGVIASQFDKYMIGMLATIGGVGIYSIGQKIANVLFSFLAALKNVFAPRVYTEMFDQGEGGAVKIGKYLTAFIYVYLLVATAMSLYSEEVILVLTPSSFHGAIDIVTILAMFYATFFFGTLPQLTYMKKTHLAPLLSFLNIILNVSFNIPFILKWGALGAAWATFLASIIYGVICFLVAQHFYKISWEYKKIGWLYCICFISGICMVLFRFVSIDYPYRLVFKTLVMGGYIGIGVFMGIITRENIALVKKIFSRSESTANSVV